VPTEFSPLIRLGCPDCGLVQRLPRLQGRQVAECRLCGRTLAKAAAERLDASLALALAAFILLLPALASPMMKVFSYGAQRESRMASGAQALWDDGFPLLGVLVGVCGVLAPFLFLALLIWVLASLRLGRPGGLGGAFRWVCHLRPWMMLEVYLVGSFVAYSRIKTVSTVEVDMGGWCVLAATLTLLLALALLDERTVWESLRWAASGKAGTRRIACIVCGLVVEETEEGWRCPRCVGVLRLRKPDAIARTVALLSASYLLYVPANVLPVLTIGYLGGEETNTILSGVLELARNQLWPLALIVLMASIILPILKMWALTWMLLAMRRRSRRLLVARTRLYRSIEVIGRWSNIDVFMAAVLVSLLQFGALSQVHAGWGLVAFAAVVVLTMLATVSFDSRLMWDATTYEPAARR
jgi:paraquat-inducible protein A